MEKRFLPHFNVFLGQIKGRKIQVTTSGNVTVGKLVQLGADYILVDFSAKCDGSALSAIPISAICCVDLEE